MVLPYRNIYPKIASDVFIGKGVCIIGDVHIGDGSSCWYNAVIRGDVNAVRIGNRSNIQDGAVLHVSYNTQALTIGNEVTVGHGCILHSCTIEDLSLIGMGATVLDGAIVRKHAFVGAGALVPPGMEIPSGKLAVGVPAKIVRALNAAELMEFQDSARRYFELAKEHVSVQE